MKLKMRYLVTNLIFCKTFSLFLSSFITFSEFLISLFRTSFHSFCSSRPFHLCFLYFCIQTATLSLHLLCEYRSTTYSQYVAVLLHFFFSYILICYYTRYFRLVHLAILNLCSLNGFPRFTLSLQVQSFSLSTMLVFNQFCNI